MISDSASYSAESQLIKKMIEGDQKAFSHLFDRYAANLLNVARKYIYNREEAEEIVQETFYRVWKYRANMDPELSFKAYIITIAKRLIFNLTKKRMHELAYQEYFIKNYVDRISDIEETIDFKELDHRIREAIDNLPPKRKEVFVLSRDQGLSTHEIARKLNISVSTVENQINKALKTIREAIALVLLFCFL